MTKTEVRKRLTLPVFNICLAAVGKEAGNISTCIDALYDEVAKMVEAATVERSAELEQIAYDFACGKTNGDEITRHVRSKLQAI